MSEFLKILTANKSYPIEFEFDLFSNMYAYHFVLYTISFLFVTKCLRIRLYETISIETKESHGNCYCISK